VKSQKGLNEVVKNEGEVRKLSGKSSSLEKVSGFMLRTGYLLPDCKSENGEVDTFLKIECEKPFKK
jgi:hypothetical protein